MSKNQLNIYHRAYKAYQKEVSASKACQKLHKAILDGCTEREYMDSMRYSCTVEKDWIERISIALPFLEKAVMENRQFILQQGSTVLIEQARRISKTSVEHLAHHSEMITRKPEAGEDIIPDKIYIVENTNNYAIYENRFLYMLLCYLQDFVGTRYSNIIKLWNQFRSDLVIDKEIRLGKRKIRFSLNCAETAEDNPATSYDLDTLECIEQIRGIQQTVTLLLNTPLMKEVSHAPMLKPPITRTNILRMDTCFKEAVALYDYLVEYHKDGYEVREFHEHMEPFSDPTKENFAQVIAMISYLSYRHGGRLEDIMEKEYEREEARRREKAEQEMLERLALLKKQVADSENSMEQYMSLLEDRNNVLEKELKEQKSLMRLLEESEERLSIAQDTCHSLRGKVDDCNRQIDEGKLTMQRMENQFKAEKQQLCEAHAQAIAEKQRQFDEIEEKLFYTAAQLHGLRQEHGLITDEDDFSSKERFAELEREYSAFQKFFSQQWKTTKKKIRKTVFGKASESETQDPDASL